MFNTPLFASSGDPLGFPTIVAAMVVMMLIIFFGFLMLVLKYYKRCPSNRLLVIYGKTGRGEAAICVQGGARFVMPLIQDYAWLSLEPMQIEVPLRGALSADKIRMSVPSVTTVAIGTSPELMQNAAIRLLGLSFREIEKQSSEIILGQLRQAITVMSIEEIIHDRDKFLSRIMLNLQPALRNLGLVV
ncbi:MAG: SPFH domain-containing protein, partial [Planctomycetota bacterium]